MCKWVIWGDLKRRGDRRQRNEGSHTGWTVGQVRLDSPGGDGVERGTRSWGHTSTHSHRSLVQGCSQERSFLGTSSLPCTCLCFSGRRKSSGKGNWSNRPYGWGTYSICHTDAPFTSQLIHEQVTSTATNECQPLHVPMHSHKHQYFHMPAHSGGAIMCCLVRTLVCTESGNQELSQAPVNTGDNSSQCQQCMLQGLGLG